MSGVTPASFVIGEAELALGCPSRVLEEWQFLKRQGWSDGWTPDSAIRRAARAPWVSRLIWC